MSAVTIGSRVAYAAEPDDVFIVSGCLDLSYTGSIPLSEALTHLNNIYDMNNAMIDGFSGSPLNSTSTSGRIWIGVNDDRIMTFTDHDAVNVLA